MYLTVRLDDPIELKIRKEYLEGENSRAYLNQVLQNPENGFLATQIEIGGFSQTNLYFLNDDGVKIEGGYFIDGRVLSRNFRRMRHDRL